MLELKTVLKYKEVADKKNEKMKLPYIFCLSEIMKEREITSQELSDKTGISKRTIDEYRSARRKEPSLSNGLLIAEALAIDPYILFMTETELEKHIKDIEPLSE